MNPDDGIGVVVEEKIRKVTFSTGLPRGAFATFNYEGQRWVAYPEAKFNAIHQVQTRLFATVERVHKDLVSWVNVHPEDASRVTRILERTVGAKQLISDSVLAWTMNRKDSYGETGQEQEEVDQQEADGA